MTDLERVREGVQRDAPWLVRYIDTHLKEDANLNVLLNANYDRAKELEAELASFREAVREWDKASRYWFDAAQARPYDAKEAASRAYIRSQHEARLRQLIEEKP